MGRLAFHTVGIQDIHEVMMGVLNYIEADLFTTDKPIISHGCNIVGGFGSGIAGQIARLFPEVKMAYKNKFEQDGWSLGEIQVVPLWRPKSPVKCIVNMATQSTYGTTGTHISYDAIRNCFDLLLRYCEMHQLGVAMPKIGAGLGGGKWDRIEDILLNSLQTHNVSVDVHVIKNLPARASTCPKPAEI